MIGVKVSQKGNAPAVLKSLPANIRRAVKRAKTDTLKKVRTELVRKTAAKYHLTASRVRASMKPTDDGLKVSGPREALESYKISPSKPSKRSRVISAAVVRAGGLKALSSRAFLLPRGGKSIVMERIGAARLPIRRLFSLAVPQAVGNYDNTEALTEIVEETFPKRLDYWVMQGIGAVKG